MFMGSELDDIFAICTDQMLSHGGKTLFIFEEEKGWEANIFKYNFIYQHHLS